MSGFEGSKGAAAGGAGSSLRLITALSNPSDRRIDENASPEHPVKDVIWPLTTNPVGA
jgi:hypothetical protein